MAKILVVDDEPDMIWAITNVLLSENHSVISVNSGEEALKKVGETPVDLMLLDFRLPGMDGIQILEQVKRIKPDLPVVMVTGYGGIEEAVQAIKLGAAHYIAKPFDNDNLVEIVNKSLHLDSLKKEGVFGKRLAEKINPRPALPERPQSEPHPARTMSSRGSGNGLGGWVKGATIAVVTLVLAGSAAFYWLNGRPRDKEFEISNSKVSGLTFGGGSLWACDWFTQTVYQYQVQDKELAVVNTVPLQGSHLTGISWGGDALFTCDSWKKTISKHFMDRTLTVAKAWPSPGPNPSGLFFDGKYLWSCDGTNNKIYQHAVDDNLTVLNAYDSPGIFPVGLYYDKKSFWSASAAGMKVFKNSVQERFKLEKTYVFANTPENAQQLSAFIIQEGQIWIAYEGVNKIFRRDPGSLQEVAP